MKTLAIAATEILPHDIIRGDSICPDRYAYTQRPPQVQATEIWDGTVMVLTSRNDLEFLATETVYVQR